MKMTFINKIQTINISLKYPTCDRYYHEKGSANIDSIFIIIQGDNIHFKERKLRLESSFS